MARLINFNTTIYYTAMSKNTEPEDLGREIEVLPQALEAARQSDGDSAVILARMVRGVSPESWEQASENFPLRHWHAFSVSEMDGDEEPAYGENLRVSPFREVQGALTSGMFTRLLARELHRLKRNGGCLALISASIADGQSVATALGKGAAIKLEGLLGATILKRLEDCDSMGILRKGQFICCLPGLGQLAARDLAEKIKSAFEESARPYFPVGGISAGHGVSCALGIINLPQGESGEAAELIRRAKISLEMALDKKDSLIHQEASYTPLENTTLVQSSEKRFLFFGGNPQ